MRSHRMMAGDALAFIIIAVLGLTFAVTVKAPELAALIETLIGGAS